MVKSTTWALRRARALLWVGWVARRRRGGRTGLEDRERGAVVVEGEILAEQIVDQHIFVGQFGARCVLHSSAQPALNSAPSGFFPQRPSGALRNGVAAHSAFVESWVTASHTRCNLEGDGWERVQARTAYVRGVQRIEDLAAHLSPQCTQHTRALQPLPQRCARGRTPPSTLAG